MPVRWSSFNVFNYLHWNQCSVQSDGQIQLLHIIPNYDNYSDYLVAIKFDRSNNILATRILTKIDKRFQTWSMIYQASLNIPSHSLISICANPNLSFLQKNFLDQRAQQRSVLQIFRLLDQVSSRISAKPLTQSAKASIDARSFRNCAKYSGRASAFPEWPRNLPAAWQGTIQESVPRTHLGASVEA